METSRPSDQTPVQLTFCVEEPPANPSLRQERAAEWMTSAATSLLSLPRWLNEFLHVGFSGKTSLEFYPAETVKTSRSSFDGLKVAGICARGEFWTLSFSDSPNEEKESGLSGILETGDHLQRYCLSGQACKGVLTRAERAGNPLSDIAKKALCSALT